ncbi:MAG: indole-3-glycerol phosphate synthase TrpC [Sphingobacterium sp.]
MTILDTIISKKREEVREARKHRSIEQFADLPLFHRACHRLESTLQDPEKSGIIAEYKRASPSKGLINGAAAIKETVSAYEAAGASAVSVLTDHHFFQGSLEDLSEARKALSIPLLRKEFIIDSFQIAEAKAYGADIILLITACLTATEITELSAYAHSLGLNVLLEVHNQEELEISPLAYIDAVGVNNRNLKDFTVSLEHSRSLIKQIPDQYLKISESGISDPATIRELKSIGYQGFLIGENFMKTNDPGKAIHQFVQQMQYD